jgi:hypothetical protein
MFQQDVEAVTGVETKLLLDARPQSKQAVIAVHRKKVHLSTANSCRENQSMTFEINGKFTYSVVDNPFPNIERSW